jgi:hypothetical protein
MALHTHMKLRSVAILVTDRTPCPTTEGIEALRSPLRSPQRPEVLTGRGLAGGDGTPRFQTMTGRIALLIRDQQFGSIVGDDGQTYLFEGRSLRGVTFAVLMTGAYVNFESLIVGEQIRRAEKVSLAPRPIKPRNDAGR